MFVFVASQQAEEDAERIAFLQIDWHDFVVVETVEFRDDDVISTPAQLQHQATLDKMAAIGDAANAETAAPAEGA